MALAKRQPQWLRRLTTKQTVPARSAYPPVAQLDNAADSDSEERGFESLQAGQLELRATFFVALILFYCDTAHTSHTVLVFSEGTFAIKAVRRTALNNARLSARQTKKSLYVNQAIFCLYYSISLKQTFKNVGECRI